MTYYKLVPKNPEEGGPPSMFVPVTEPLLTAAEWRATIDYEAAAKSFNADGWTCEMHEPMSFGVCAACFISQMAAARNAVDAAYGEDEA